jgi:tripartite-type tricarboxylate transporter receptor subunit TctC
VAKKTDLDYSHQTSLYQARASLKRGARKEAFGGEQKGGFMNEPLHAGAWASRLLTRAFLALAIIIPFAVAAQEYPNKPIRMIHPIGAGSSGDILGRFMSNFASKELGQPIYVENIAGAGGTLALTQAARAAPDGHTIVLMTQAGPVAENLFEKLNYRLLEDFAPVSQLATSYYVLNVIPSLPVRSIEELIKLAKSKPGQLNYSTAGNGTGVHLAAALLQTSTGIDIVHVPFKGTGPALNAALGGQVQMIFLGVPSSRELIRTGKLRALGVTARKRSAGFPDLPAIAELIPGYEMSVWQGLAVPAGTPRAIINKLEAAHARVLKLPEVLKKFEELDVEVVGSTPEEFGTYLKTQVKIYADLMRKVRIQVD